MSVTETPQYSNIQSKQFQKEPNETIFRAQYTMTDYNVGLIINSREVLISYKGDVPSCTGETWETLGNLHKEHLANPCRMIWDGITLK